MAQVKVYPLHETALRAYSGTTRSGHKLGHPTGGDLRVDGSQWEEDSFTYRAMHDGDITMDEAQAWRAPSKTAADNSMTPRADELSPTPTKKPKLDAV